MAVSSEVRGHAHIFAASLAKLIGASGIGDADIRTIVDRMSGSLEGVTNPHAIPMSAFTDIAKQVESYKVAALQTPKNDFAAGANKNDADNSGLPRQLSPMERMISARFLSESGANGGGSSDPRSSARYAMNSQPGQSGAPALSDPAFLRSMNINAPVAGALAAMGFTTQAQVRQVVNDTKKLGLEPNAGAINLGKLRQAEGPRTDQHVDRLAQYRQQLEQLEQQRRAAEQQTDAAKKAATLRQIDAQRKQALEAIDKYRDQKVVTPDGKRAFDATREQIQQSVEQSRAAREAAPAVAKAAPGEPAPPKGDALKKGKKVTADPAARAAAAADIFKNQEAEKEKRLVAEAARTLKGDTVVQERMKAAAALDDFAPTSVAGAPPQAVRQAQAGPASVNSPAATPQNASPAAAKGEQPKGATPEKPQSKTVAQNAKAAGPTVAV